jgi:nucleoside-diphosphate-sugar epimerase
MDSGKKKVLVTGASGFLGSHICEALHEAGYEVHALIRENSSRIWLKKSWIHVHPLGFDKDTELLDILSGIDSVIHTAGRVFGTREELWEANLEVTVKLVNLCIASGIRRFVYASTQSVGGPSKGPYPKSPEDPDCPESSYGQSKKAAEDEINKKSKKIHITSLRYSPVYGPRDKESLRMFKTLQGRIHPLFGSKPIYTNMVYAEDAARAAVVAVTADTPSGSVYNINDGVDYTMAYLYDLITEALENKRGVRIKVPFWVLELASWWENTILGRHSVFNKDKIGEFRARFWLASSQKAVDELNWKPEVKIRDGLKETVWWYRVKKWL